MALKPKPPQSIWRRNRRKALSQIRAAVQLAGRSLRSSQPHSHIMSYGEAEGKPLPNLSERLVRRSRTFTRLHVGHLDNAAPCRVKGFAEVTGMIVDGCLKLPIAGVFTMERAEDMFAVLESRQTVGKLILWVAD